MTRILTLQELAEILQVHDSTVRRMLRRGELSGFRVGCGPGHLGSWRFAEDTIEAWRKAQEQKHLHSPRP